MLLFKYTEGLDLYADWISIHPSKTGKGEQIEKSTEGRFIELDWY